MCVEKLNNLSAEEAPLYKRNLYSEAVGRQVSEIDLMNEAAATGMSVEEIKQQLGIR